MLVSFRVCVPQNSIWVVTSFVFSSGDFVWIVLFVQKRKDDPRSHIKQHQPKDSCLELAPTFEAEPCVLVDRFFFLKGKATARSSLEGVLSDVIIRHRLPKIKIAAQIKPNDEIISKTLPSTVVRCSFTRDLWSHCRCSAKSAVALGNLSAIHVPTGFASLRSCD